jgi:hypothetical protein
MNHWTGMWFNHMPVQWFIESLNHCWVIHWITAAMPVQWYIESHSMNHNEHACSVIQWITGQAWRHTKRCYTHTDDPHTRRTSGHHLNKSSMTHIYTPHRWPTCTPHKWTRSQQSRMQNNPRGSKTTMGLTRRGPLIVKSEGEVVNLWLSWSVSYLSVRSASRSDECAALVASRICTIRWWREEWGACLLERRKRGLGGRRWKGVGVMRDKELKLDDDWVIQWVTEIQWITLNMPVRWFSESLNRHLIQSHACSVVHTERCYTHTDDPHTSHWTWLFSVSLNHWTGMWLFSDSLMQWITEQAWGHTQRCNTHTDDPHTRRTSGHDLNNQACHNKIGAKIAHRKGAPQEQAQISSSSPSQAAPRANCTFFFLWPI